jgi:hypothetical protein
MAPPVAWAALAWARCRFSRLPLASAASAFRFFNAALLLDWPTNDGRSLRSPRRGPGGQAQQRVSQVQAHGYAPKQAGPDYKRARMAGPGIKGARCSSLRIQRRQSDPPATRPPTSAQSCAPHGPGAGS